MSHYLQSAIISEKSKRYQEWLDVFGSNVVPITNALNPTLVSVLGVEREVYFLALRQLTPLQRSRLIHHIAIKFGIPVAEVEASIDEVGVPILADDCVAAYDYRLIM